MENEFTQLQQAAVTTQYRDILILHLDVLTVSYRDLLRHYAQGSADETMFNDCLTEMIVILDHLHPKLEGGGQKTEALLEQFKEFASWTENIMIPKANMDQRTKMHKLFKLIVKAYDVLGLSRY